MAMVKSKLQYLTIICLIIMMATSACAPQTNNSQNITGEKPGAYVCFNDALGRRVELTEKPQKVAALLGSFADVWYLAGGDVCATAEDAWDDFGLEPENAVNIGGAHSPSLELLVSADPDFVLASASTASNVEMKTTLEKMGITVAYFDIDNFDDYLKMLDICTDITGRKDLYEQNGLSLRSKIENITNQYKNAGVPEGEKKILLLRAASTTVKAKGSRGTILGEMLSDFGCINIADNAENLLENLSVEAVIKENPYHIFVVTMGSNTDKAIESIEKMITDNPAWNGLEAVKEGRLHIMDKKLYNLKPNARYAEAYEKLYETLTEK